MLIGASFMVWSVFFHYSQGKGHNIKVRNGLIVSFKACKSIIFGITNGTQKKLILTLFQNNDDFCGSYIPESIFQNSTVKFVTFFTLWKSNAGFSSEYLLHFGLGLGPYPFCFSQSRANKRQ